MPTSGTNGDTASLPISKACLIIPNAAELAVSTSEDIPISTKIISSVGLVSLSLLASIAQGQGGPSQVLVAPAESIQIAPTMRLVGSIRPRLRSVIAAEVGGIVAELPVEIGDRVKKGQLLCKLRDVTRVAAHAEAVAKQSQMNAALEEANAMLQKAAFENERIEGLWKENRSSEKEHNDASAEHRAAVGRAKQAEFALQGQEAIVRMLADNLAQTEILAPFDGVIITKRTEVGAWVGEGGEIVEAVDLSVARARVSVPEAIIAYCKVGGDALVSVDALNSDYPAKISRIVPDADERARTFPVEVDIENANRELRAGMFVSVAVPSGPPGERLVVPKDAVVVRGPSKMLFVVRDGESGAMAMPLPVTVVSEVKDKVAVDAAGLAAGDRVIIRGNEYMFAPGPVIVLPNKSDAQGTDNSADTAARVATTQSSSEG